MLHSFSKKLIFLFLLRLSFNVFNIYALPFKDIFNAAELGNPIAQCKIGYCYEFGIEVEKDMNEAFLWYEKSASQDNSNAQYNLGLCYEFGKGVEVNLNWAAFLYYKAYSQGLKKALHNDEIVNLKSKVKYYNNEGFDEDDIKEFIDDELKSVAYIKEQGPIKAGFAIWLIHNNIYSSRFFSWIFYVEDQLTLLLKNPIYENFMCKPIDPEITKLDLKFKIPKPEEQELSSVIDSETSEESQEDFFPPYD